MPTNKSEPRRCDWAEPHPLLRQYHDEEWGVPIHDDRHWYEKLLLDGAQAGLSWLTILKKREGYREAFADFDFEKVARFDARRVEKLLTNPEIVRNRLKVESAISNARAFLSVIDEHGSFDRFIWARVGGAPIQHRRQSMADIPARTELSDALSKELKTRGFRFVGSTIVYAFMQAAGIVNDHLTCCPRHLQVQGPAGAGPRRGRSKR